MTLKSTLGLVLQLSLLGETIIQNSPTLNACQLQRNVAKEMHALYKYQCQELKI